MLLGVLTHGLASSYGVSDLAEPNALKLWEKTEIKFFILILIIYFILNDVNGHLLCN